MLTYMTHPKHGTHIAYDENEVKAAELNGWTAHGSTPPGAQSPEQRSIQSVAESQAPDTAQALETGDAGVAPGRTAAAPDRPVLHVKRRGPGRPRKAR